MALPTCRTLLATSCLVWVFAADAVAAVDADRFRLALEAQLAAFGSKIELGSVAGRGEDIIITDVRVSSEKGPATTFPSVRLENVQAVRGGFNVGRVAVPTNTFPSPDGTVEFGGLTVTNITVPEQTAPRDVFFYWLGVDVSPMRFLNAAGQDIAKVSRIKMTGTPISTERDNTFAVEPFDVFIDTTLAPKTGTDPGADQGAVETLQALGLTRLNMRIASRGAWRMSDGRLTMDTTFQLRDAGTLGLKLGVKGYTLDVMHALNEASKVAAAATDKTIAGQESGGRGKKDIDGKTAMAFIGIAQQLSLSNVSFRFDDASLTGRLLDFTSRKNGVPRKDLVNQIKGMVPVLAMQTNDPTFATSAANAVSAFLDNPKSIEIRAEPPTPVSFMQLFAIGAAAPQALIKQLNVTIIANKP